MLLCIFSISLYNIASFSLLQSLVGFNLLWFSLFYSNPYYPYIFHGFQYRNVYPVSLNQPNRLRNSNSVSIIGGITTMRGNSNVMQISYSIK